MDSTEVLVGCKQPADSQGIDAALQVNIERDKSSVNSEETHYCHRMRNIAFEKLKTIESACDEELRQEIAALQAAKCKIIRIIDVCYEEILRKLNERHQKVKEELLAMRVALNDCVQHTLLIKLLNGSNLIPSLLRVVITDVENVIAEAVLNSFTCLEEIQVVDCLDVAKRKQIVQQLIDDSEGQVRDEHFECALADIREAKSLGFQCEEKERQISEKLTVLKFSNQLQLLERTWRSVSEEEMLMLAEASISEASHQINLQLWLAACSILKLLRPQLAAGYLHELACFCDFQLNLLSEAELRYTDALQLYDSTSQDRGVCLANLAALLHLKLRRFSEAEVRYTEALHILDPTSEYRADCLHSLAIMLAANPDRFHEAEQKY